MSTKHTDTQKSTNQVKEKKLRWWKCKETLDHSFSQAWIKLGICKTILGFSKSYAQKVFILEL